MYSNVLLHSVTHQMLLHYLPEQEATSLGTDEYNEVVLSVENIVDPDISIFRRKESEEITTITPQKCVQISVNMHASENGNPS